MIAANTEMKSGSCPKCGGNDIRLQHRGWGHRNFLPSTFWGKAIRLDNYACVTCGFVESYVEPGDFDRLANSWAIAPEKRSVMSARVDGAF
ncbi:MAG: hypothetical protein M3552_19915 [Planctomycetota bacterium]|nr:hypothetical protein [Planctomycetaceae bacterium]MDQ3332884.1 hypothetical protein [Planctomycetota bacterium]